MAARARKQQATFSSDTAFVYASTSSAVANANATAVAPYMVGSRGFSSKTFAVASGFEKTQSTKTVKIQMLIIKYPCICTSFVLAMETFLTFPFALIIFSEASSCIDFGVAFEAAPFFLARFSVPNMVAVYEAVQLFPGKNNQSIQEYRHRNKRRSKN